MIGAIILCYLPRQDYLFTYHTLPYELIYCSLSKVHADRLQSSE